MKANAYLIAISALTIGVATQAAVPMLHEEAFAHEQEKLIITAPIAGIHNSLWFDYRIDVTEAQKELSRDLRKASDIEDQREAWEEYGNELHKERVHYVRKMEKRGFRVGTVTVENN